LLRGFSLRGVFPLDKGNRECAWKDSNLRLAV
jgi:hypothetical protein